MFPIAVTWPTPSIQLLAACIHVLLASLVTADVLLKKSDVRAALGWIAAAWLSPFFGSLLYFMFGINRVTRRALQMAKLDEPQALPPGFAAEPSEGSNIATLADVGRRVSGTHLNAGNEISILQGGDDAYSAMLSAIRGARHSVALTSYIFRNDAAGREFCDALRETRQRGVEVRVLLDSVGIGYLFPLILYRLKGDGINAARFLHTWVPWRMPFLNMRNHRKLLVVDGNTAFMGGMNIGAEYSRRLARHAYVDDVHFRVEGPVVRSVMDAFARDWTFTTYEPLDQDFWWPTLPAAGPVLARGLRSGPDADIYKLEMILGAALTLAKRRFRIVSPYFLPDQRLQFAIGQACLRGVQVEIVIPGHCNYVFLNWAMRAHLRFFRHIPVNIYMTPLPFDHSKLATMDGEWCLIGSSNWDARSFRLNFEYDLECYDADLTGRLNSIIDGKIARAHEVSYGELMAQPKLVRIRDSAARLLMPYL